MPRTLLVVANSAVQSNQIRRAMADAPALRPVDGTLVLPSASRERGRYP
jgi:hypothetical protein